jgi:hypothetical protein
MSTPNEHAEVQNVARSRRFALSKWENEGGAAIGGHPEGPVSRVARSIEVASIDAELTRLRIRVIALESLVAAILVQCSDRQLDGARDMASYIAPRAGNGPHPLTIKAAARMVRLVARAGRFRALRRL